MEKETLEASLQSFTATLEEKAGEWRHVSNLLTYSRRLFSGYHWVTEKQRRLFVLKLASMYACVYLRVLAYVRRPPVFSSSVEVKGFGASNKDALIVFMKVGEISMHTCVLTMRFLRTLVTSAKLTFSTMTSEPLLALHRDTALSLFVNYFLIYHGVIQYPLVQATRAKKTFEGKQLQISWHADIKTPASTPVKVCQ